jgi:hypothetical protein
MGLNKAMDIYAVSGDSSRAYNDIISGIRFMIKIPIIGKIFVILSPVIILRY